MKELSDINENSEFNADVLEYSDIFSINYDDETELLGEEEIDEYLTFNIENELYAIEISSVYEIISISPITKVPELPAYIKGLINLRGKIIPVIDLRMKLSKVEIPYNERTCIIILEHNHNVVGIIVDEISDVINISEEFFISQPEIEDTYNNKIIKSMAMIDGDTSNIALIIGVDLLLSENL